MKYQERKGKEANGFASVGHTETGRRKEDTGLGDRIGNKSERRVGSRCYIHGGSSNEKLEVTQPLQLADHTPQGESGSGTKNRATTGDQGVSVVAREDPGRVQGAQNTCRS